jgi:hypothetical protein
MTDQLDTRRGFKWPAYYKVPATDVKGRLVGTFVLDFGKAQVHLLGSAGTPGSP